MIVLGSPHTIAALFIVLALISIVMLWAQYADLFQNVRYGFEYKTRKEFLFDAIPFYPYVCLIVTSIREIYRGFKKLK